jgi:hypothetical protein
MQGRARFRDYKKQIRVPESGLPRIGEKQGPAVYAVLQCESAPIELVSRLTAGYVCPFHRAHGKRALKPPVYRRNRLFFHPNPIFAHPNLQFKFFYTAVFRLGGRMFKTMSKSAVP